MISVRGTAVSIHLYVEDADATHEELNPLCGDRIRISVRVREGRVDAVRFRGDACAIAVANSSIAFRIPSANCIGTTA